MKLILKIIGVLLLTAIIFVGGFVLYISSSGIPQYPELVKDPGITVHADSAMLANGERLASMLCVQCHLNRQTNLVTGQLLPDVAQFGKAYSANITQDKKYGIGAWTDGQLIYLLRTGVKPDGGYAPPWMPKFVHMSDYDLQSIVGWLHSDDARLKATAEATIPSEPNFLAKFLTHVAFKPIPYPTGPVNAPDTSDHVAYGKYIVQGKIECWACHSASFKTLNVEFPDKTPGYMGGGNPITDAEGKIVYSANLTPDEATGIGKWTEGEFVKAVKYGIRPDGTTNRYPMVPYARMTDWEARAIFAYLKTLPPKNNPIKRDL